MQNYDINNIINQLKDKQWRKRGKWYHSAIFNEIFGIGESTDSCARLGYPFKKSVSVWLANGDYLDLVEEWNGIRQVVEQEYAKDAHFLHNYADHCLEMGEGVIAFSKEIQQRDAAALTDEE